MKVHAQKAIACILLISLVASVTNTLFSNLILLQSGDRTDQISKGTPISKTGISTTKSADIFSVLAQEEGGGDEESQMKKLQMKKLEMKAIVKMMIVKIMIVKMMIVKMMIVKMMTVKMMIVKMMIVKMMK